VGTRASAWHRNLSLALGDEPEARQDGTTYSFPSRVRLSPPRWTTRLLGLRAVMRASTTSKAATLLGDSRPAVSQSIRKFESACELRLFERMRGRLVPTQEALSPMVEVDRCFTGFELIEHRIRSLKSFGLGRRAIGSLPALGTGFMQRAIAAFGLDQRQVQLSFQVMSSREVYQQVSAGQLDFGLMADELSVPGIEHSKFVTVPAVIALNAQHPLARKNPRCRRPGEPRIHRAQPGGHAAVGAQEGTRRPWQGPEAGDRDTVLEFGLRVCAAWGGHGHGAPGDGPRPRLAWLAAQAHGVRPVGHVPASAAPVCVSEQNDRRRASTIHKMRVATSTDLLRARGHIA
jgi:DNA-binding transcriptional LysR family regulator